MPVRLRHAALACLVAGALLLVVLDHPATIAAGVLLLAAFIVLGLVAIANPDDLGPGEDDR